MSRQTDLSGEFVDEGESGGGFRSDEESWPLPYADPGNAPGSVRHHVDVFGSLVEISHGTMGLLETFEELHDEVLSWGEQFDRETRVEDSVFNARRIEVVGQMQKTVEACKKLRRDPRPGIVFSADLLEAYRDLRERAVEIQQQFIDWNEAFDLVTSVDGGDVRYDPTRQDEYEERAAEQREAVEAALREYGDRFERVKSLFVENVDQRTPDGDDHEGFVANFRAGYWRSSGQPPRLRPAPWLSRLSRLNHYGQLLLIVAGVAVAASGRLLPGAGLLVFGFLFGNVVNFVYGFYVGATASG